MHNAFQAFQTIPIHFIGTDIRRRRYAADVRTESFDSSGGSVIAASISATISLWGICEGVAANLGPFIRMARSLLDKGLLDRLITHFSRSSVSRSGVHSLFRFPSFFSCLAEMLLWTDLARCFKNWESRE